jgi:hypothetical protein
MEGMIHVSKVTANVADGAGAEAEVRHSLIVFVRCENVGSAYAPVDAYLRQTGWKNIELVECKPLPPEAVEKLDDSLRTAYREAEAHGVAAVLLKSS